MYGVSGVLLMAWSCEAIMSHCIAMQMCMICWTYRAQVCPGLHVLVIRIIHNIGHSYLQTRL